MMILLYNDDFEMVYPSRINKTTILARILPKFHLKVFNFTLSTCAQVQMWFKIKNIVQRIKNHQFYLYLCIVCQN